MEPQVNNPLVFLCRQCQSIVGDSFHMTSSEQQLNAVVLNAGHPKNTKVLRDGQFSTSQRGADAGATFWELSCAVCTATVGKVYETTPRALDRLRGMHCFSRDALESYELGSCAAAGAPALRGGAAAMQGGAGGGAAAAGSGAGGGSAAGAVEDCQQEITKLKDLLLLFNERISKLEQAGATSSAKRSRG